jgi:hypothetical protein
VLYLDIPDLAALRRTNHYLARVATDAWLHHTRLRVVAPSRLRHFLIAQPDLRPSVLDLVNRGVIRGLSVERRWRAGAYLYSPQVC